MEKARKKYEQEQQDNDPLLRMNTLLKQENSNP